MASATEGHNCSKKRWASVVRRRFSVGTSDNEAIRGPMRGQETPWFTAGPGDGLLELNTNLSLRATLTRGQLLNLPKLHGAAVRIK